MAARRMLILMIILLGLSSLAAALVPIERARLGEEQTTEQTTTSERAEPGGRLVRRMIDADARPPERVAIRVGDQLELRVTARRPDIVAIPGLGESDDVDRAEPAAFDLLPYEPGAYTLRLLEAGRSAGRLVIEPRRARR